MGTTLPDFVYTCFMVTPYGNVLRFLPPLVFGDDLLDDTLGVLDDAVAKLAG